MLGLCTQVGINEQIDIKCTGTHTDRLTAGTLKKRLLRFFFKSTVVINRVVTFPTPGNLVYSVYMLGRGK